MAILSNKTDDTVVEKAPVEGTSETHINAFLHDMDAAFEQARAALAEVELKYKALREKLGI